LNTTETDPVVFEKQAATVCELYRQAPQLAQGGTHLLSTDEMTGIQALQRAAPTKGALPGQLEKREFEYIRHGTLTLIGNMEVATGRIMSSSILPSRTEADFLAHIEQTLENDPAGQWIFILDQLNTHQSASLVEMVNRRLGLNAPNLGIKGQVGILANMPSRQSFLADPSHRIRFVYTPKHSSWLNQIEIWFSILKRRLLRRASFESVAELEQRLLSFIDYFNRVAAKPFKWTYTGRPLQA
jgi:transposase